MATSVVRTRLAATASVLALTIAAPALAQTAPNGGATAVDDIIVTAQKREESIQDVPIAVSAFSAETLDAMKIEGGGGADAGHPQRQLLQEQFQYVQLLDPRDRDQGHLGVV